MQVVFNIFLHHCLGGMIQNDSCGKGLGGFCHLFLVNLRMLCAIWVYHSTFHVFREALVALVLRAERACPSMSPGPQGV